MVPAATPAVLIHSPASIFLPSAGCTRVTLKRPSAQTTVNPSASTATIWPSLPPMPLGSFAGSGLASNILSCLPPSALQAPGEGPQGHRSEEHTSELQSLRHLVCRLLLEKKNKIDNG